MNGIPIILTHIASSTRRTASSIARVWILLTLAALIACAPSNHPPIPFGVTRSPAVFATPFVSAATPPAIFLLATPTEDTVRNQLEDQLLELGVKILLCKFDESFCEPSGVVLVENPEWEECPDADQRAGCCAIVTVHAKYTPNVSLPDDKDLIERAQEGFEYDMLRSRTAAMLMPSAAAAESEWIMRVNQKIAKDITQELLSSSMEIKAHGVAAIFTAEQCVGTVKGQLPSLERKPVANFYVQYARPVTRAPGLLQILVAPQRFEFQTVPVTPFQLTLPASGAFSTPPFGNSNTPFRFPTPVPLFSTCGWIGPFQWSCAP
ncbi:MAG TPA: hypothetical protein VFD70_08975 [Anaerolineae bacterium]|nr:hypothetical protein [Anaerolineae bacterium]